MAEKALLLLGVPSADVGVQVSNASDEDTGDPDYPSDVTDIDYDPNSPYARLEYTGNNGTNWYIFEGNFKAEDGSTWKYWTCYYWRG
jgi:hypothetical protein